MGEEDRGFRIRDRRQTEQGESRERSANTADPSGAAAGSPRSSAGELTEIDFAAFVLSLATSAQINLGSVPHPETNQTIPNIPAAKQMIDIMGMLQQKTKGNLSKEEESLLEQVLFNLRMHYVRIAEGQKKSGGS